MSQQERNNLQKELKFLEEEKQRINNLISTLPDLEKRKHDIIIKLYPHHGKNKTSN